MLPPYNPLPITYDTLANIREILESESIEVLVDYKDGLLDGDISLLDNESASIFEDLIKEYTLEPNKTACWAVAKNDARAMIFFHDRADSEDAVERAVLRIQPLWAGLIRIHGDRKLRRQLEMLLAAGTLLVETNRRLLPFVETNLRLLWNVRDDFGSRFPMFPDVGENLREFMLPGVSEKLLPRKT